MVENDGDLGRSWKLFRHVRDGGRGREMLGGGWWDSFGDGGHIGDVGCC
jgi:hypothetical protein